MSLAEGLWEGSQPLGEDWVMPIAIVGLGGRFPGDASSPDKLWDLISKGRSALTKVPKDRFNVDAFYHPHHERQGTLNVQGAHFMESDITAFDAPFFSITPAEAKAMDPQQRMLLECTYEALENGGIRMEDVTGSNTSCFTGCFTNDYGVLVAADREDYPLYLSTGTGAAIMSNRISWFYDLKGPSVSLDTACSSSMVALHLACQSLRTGESKMSIVGGTNLILLPDIMSAMANLHFLSPDGKCQSFDSKGNGYSRGEGVAVIILKPLHLALRDHDVIRGVIRNTAVNQDGNTPGITVPSTKAQEALIRNVYDNAGLNLADTGYVEAHGTGTPAGDPVEVAALAATFGKARPHGDRLIVGSIKTNIGHLEGGSGLAQVMKAVFTLEKGLIPPNLWFEKANPRIPMDDWNITVPTQLTVWPKAGPRRISINSFGYGGTNAHCILDDAYHYLKARGLQGNHNTVKGIDDSPSTCSADSGIDISPPASNNIVTTLPTGWSSLKGIDFITSKELSKSPKLFVWSSHEQLGIERTAGMYSGYLSTKLSELAGEDDETLLKRFSCTLAARRSILPWKSFAIASSVQELTQSLMKPPVKPVRSSKPPKLAFIFTGQGAQWHAMGRELCIHQVFKESLEAASAYMTSIGSPWSLLAELWHEQDSSKINSAALSQPVCTALQVALIDLLKHWGVKPSAVAGHSSGEIAAAYAKGAISREAAWSISYHRGRLAGLLRSLAPNLKGAMLAVSLEAAKAQEYLDRIREGNAVVACINSHESLTLSGDAKAIDQVEKLIKDDGYFTRRLRVDTAYHSPHMQVIAESYLHSLSGLTTLPNEKEGVNMFSSVTGQLIENSDLGPSYWVSNMLNKVNFLGAVDSLCKHSGGTKKTKRATKAYVDIFVEIGPHGALQGPLKQILSAEPKTADIASLSILTRGTDASVTALDTIGRLFQRGYPVDVTAANNDTKTLGKDAFLVDIPSFAWNHANKYWFESNTGKDHRFRKHPRKDLFGYMINGLELEPRWRNVVRLTENPWVASHKVQGTILYPAAGMMVAAIEAARQSADPDKEIEGYELRDILIGKAIVIPADETGVETMLCMRPWRLGSQSSTAVWQEFTLYSRQEMWEQNCSGLLRVKYKSDNNALFADENAATNSAYRQKFYEVAEECPKSQNSRQFYEHMTTIGLQYEGVFQNLIEIKEGHFRSKCTLKIPDTKSTMPMKFEYDHVIHPATLDNVIQMALPASTGLNEELTAPKVPTSVERLYVSADMPSAPGSMLYGYAVAGKQGFHDGEATVVASSADWEKPLVIFEGIRSNSLSGATGNISSTIPASMRKLTSYIHWKEDITKLGQDEIKAICVAAAQGENDDSDVVAELELGAFIFIKRVLKAISPEEAARLSPHLQRFYQYMQWIYTKVIHGEVAHQTSLKGVNWLDTSEEFEKELLTRVARDSTDGAVMYRHGINLVEILRGEIPPLQVLMEDNLLHNWYSSGIGCSQNFAQLAQYIHLLAHKKPDMKILEVGAGTGGATLPLLQILGGQNGTSPRFSNYTFTDISSGFFEKAHEKLKAWGPFMSYARLNIEEEPTAQGFQEGQYDVIIACNVLHATHSIDKTLANVRKLMKPDGKLVLTEITNPLLRANMIVGSLEGWWMGQDDGRKMGPLMTESEWHSALVRQKFSGLDLALPDLKDPKDRMLTLLVSSASVPEAEPIPQDIIIIEPDVPGDEIYRFCRLTAETLKKQGAEVSIVKLGEVRTLNLEKKSCLVLLDCESKSPLLPDIGNEAWEALQRIILQPANTTWVSRGGTVNSESPFSNMMTGMARSIRAENPQLAFTTLDLDYTTPIDTQRNVDLVLKVFISGANSKHNPRPEWEYAVRNDKPLVQRILMEKGMNDLIATYNTTPEPEMAPFKQPGRPLTLQVGTPGRLDTLQFVDDKTCAEPLKGDDVEIEVKGVGLNFKDIMVAMGQLQQPVLGLECSGIVNRIGTAVKRFKPGDRVMTWGLGTFCNFARNPESMVQPIPDGMDYGTAASLPLIYSTAYYALFDAARLRRGETVLVHGAAGGVGQAGIILAQHIGAEVFATVSSEAKKQLLIETYNIPEDHIFNSRDDSFVQGIMRMTNHRGVDVVLNSLAGEALRQSWHCIAWFGRFIELGQKDIVGNTGLDMAPFIRNLTFHSVNMIGVLENNLPLASRIFETVMELLRKGITLPIQPITSMPFSRLEEAFRLMQTGKHMGKLVLEPTEDDLVPAIPPSVAPYRFHSNATYVLSGGSGGLGRSFARWMVQNGARNIVFLSRSGSRKPEMQETMRTLVKQGAKVAAYCCDVGNEQEIINALNQCANEFPPIRGVIQGAMVLHDTIFQNMTRDQFMTAVRPKVQGSWNLHKHLPRDMDFFVLLSSTAGIAGTRGQSNYSAGNAFQDALAHYRRSQGLPGESIDVGLVLGVGFLADNMEDKVLDNVRSWNLMGIREKELLAIVQASITGESIHGQKIPPQLITGLGTGGMMAHGGQSYPWWFDDAKFAHIVQVDTHQVAQEGDEESVQVQAILAQVENMDAAVDVVCKALMVKLAKSMMVPLDDIESSRPISSYGVDSLLAVELRTWLFRELQADISVFDLLSNVPILTMSRKIAAKSKCVPASVVEADT